MALILVVFVAVYLCAGIIYLGLRKEGYSHIKHTISELGEHGARDEKIVGYGLFLMVGLLLIALAILLHADENAAGLAVSIAVGYIVAAFFPCDVGSPSGGSWKQQIHNLGGFIEYAGGVYFLMRASENGMQLFSVDFKTFGLIIIGCIIVVSIPKNPVRGLAQRIAELLLFSCLAYLTA
ncbi:MAG: DUF998 domain-containing protein [Panacibacter sp.]